MMSGSLHEAQDGPLAPTAAPGKECRDSSPGAARWLAALLLLLIPAPAAWSDSTPQTLPFSQGWSNTVLITADDSWTGVPGIIGYRGDDITTSTGTDPQTLLADGTGTPVDVNANQTNPNTFTTGGVAEFHITDAVVALNGSGTADAPFLLIHLNTTGLSSINVQYNLRDLDGSADNSVQQVALHYRVGSTGTFTNVAGGYVADATTGPSLATLVTAVNVTLPAAAANQALVQVRIMTTNAAGNDEWVGVDDISITGTPIVESAPSVSSTTPADDAVDVSVSGTITINFSEAVDVTVSGVTLECPAGTAIPFTGLPALNTSSVILTPSSALPFSTTCAATVVASQVNDADASDPPDLMTANYPFDFTTAADVCNLPFTPVYTIQGSGASTPIPGAVTTRGIVVGDFELPTGSGQVRGFFLQDESGDGDPATSDGIFVFTGGADHVAVGDRVRVAGTAGEFQGQTQLSGTLTIHHCGTGTVPPVDVTLPVPDGDFLERFEGMLVRLPQTLTVTENYNLGRFGEVEVSSPGGRLLQPTQVAAPGAPALAVAAANALDRLIIDDANNSENADPIVFGRGASPLSAANTLRAGDTVTGVVGVLTYGWGGNAASPNAYRVRPLGALGGAPPDFQPANARPAAPDPVGGSLTVASMNLLNYFNTFSGCTGGVDGAAVSCRGASNATELARQAAKTVAAILGTGADIVAVIEMENDGYGPASAIQDLVDRLNAATAPGTFAFIDADAATGTVNALGLDAIKNALIYKPGKVTPVGTTAALATGAFSETVALQRPPLAQAFQQAGPDTRFVVVVNHFKSKGSPCTGDPDTGDGQGNCNQTRLWAANDLTAWLATDPTGAGDPDVLIVGDLNAYAMEDPITAIKGSGYVNLVEGRIGNGNAYSYMFDAQAGYLDHALATASLDRQITGVSEWHVNADEPPVLDYNTEFKTAGQVASLYAPDAYRAADHDPLVIGLDLAALTTISGATATGTGPASAAIAGGGPACTFLSYEWIDASSLPSPPPGVAFPHGLLDFTLHGCLGPVTVTITFPASPVQLAPWKYGATSAEPSPHWYAIPGATVTQTTMTFTVEDGGQGDGDRALNGLIDDPAGPAYDAAMHPVPALGPAGLVALLLLLTAAGALALRR
jgi:hypothetical protein